MVKVAQCWDDGVLNDVVQIVEVHAGHHLDHADAGSIEARTVHAGDAEPQDLRARRRNCGRRT